VTRTPRIWLSAIYVHGKKAPNAAKLPLNLTYAFEVYT